MVVSLFPMHTTLPRGSWKLGPHVDLEFEVLQKGAREKGWGDEISTYAVTIFLGTRVLWCCPHSTVFPAQTLLKVAEDDQWSTESCSVCSTSGLCLNRQVDIPLV